MSRCLWVLGSRSHSRASSWPFLPLVATVPVTTGCPISVTPGERVATVAWLVRSTAKRLHWPPSPPTSGGATACASLGSAPLLVIFRRAGLAKRRAPPASAPNDDAVNGATVAELGAGQCMV